MVTPYQHIHCITLFILGCIFRNVPQSHLYAYIYKIKWDCGTVVCYIRNIPYEIPYYHSTICICMYKHTSGTVVLWYVTKNAPLGRVFRLLVLSLH